MGYKQLTENERYQIYTLNKEGFIQEVPAVVDRWNRIGDWEGDTVIGKWHQGALLTMVERKTLYTVIARLTGKNAKRLADEEIELVMELQDDLLAA